MSTNKTDVVGEYLHEVEMRVSGLPLLQRRELLADLESHIAAARDEGARTEGELIEVLERLGSPEVVAAAAHEEAGTRFVQPAPRGQRRLWPILVAAGVALVVLFLCFGAFFFARNSSDEGPAVAPPEVTAEPDPARPS